MSAAELDQPVSPRYSEMNGGESGNLVDQTGRKEKLPTFFAPLATSSSGRAAALALVQAAESGGDCEMRLSGLIVNADDWGRDCETTERIVKCISYGAVSSVSAMVFMEDSERAADIAHERGIDAGLHLNFTTPFSLRGSPARLVEQQRELARCLLRHRFAQSLFYPTLMRSFEYVTSAQLDEYQRIYGVAPGRLDGHHHMHLCPNVLLARLLPQETIVRRSFSFRRGERSFGNRLYRQVVDRMLSRHHRVTDFFFSLPPFQPRDRLERIFLLARKSIVEVETHPSNADEYKFLTDGEIHRQTVNCRIAPRFLAHSTGRVLLASAPKVHP